MISIILISAFYISIATLINIFSRGPLKEDVTKIPYILKAGILFLIMILTLYLLG